MKEYATFYRKGHTFFYENNAEINLNLVFESIEALKSRSKNVERKMQDRHSIVPKVRLLSKYLCCSQFLFRKFTNIQPACQWTPTLLWKDICLSVQRMRSRRGIDDGFKSKRISWYWFSLMHFNFVLILSFIRIATPVLKNLQLWKIIWSCA